MYVCTMIARAKKYHTYFVCIPTGCEADLSVQIKSHAEKVNGSRHPADQEPPSKRRGGWMEPMFETRNFNDDTVFKANTQAPDGKTS